MAVTRIQTSTVDPNYLFTVELDGVEFRMRFKYNDRDSAWYFTFYDSGGNLLRAGLKVVNEFPLLRLWAQANRPKGEMIAVNVGSVIEPPTVDQLGAEVVLTYLDSVEVAAVEASSG